MGLLSLKITVLGKSPSWQDAGGACSGYLIETDQTRVLLDCGNGVFGKLRERVDYTEVDAVVISHLHADHFLDLVPLLVRADLRPRSSSRSRCRVWDGTDNPARPRLIAPPGAVETFRRVVGAWGNDDLIESAFRIEGYLQGDRVEVEDVWASFHPVPHFVETFAVRIGSDGGGGEIAYSADTRPGNEIVEVARDADLLIIEGTLPRPERTGLRGGGAGRRRPENTRSRRVRSASSSPTSPTNTGTTGPGSRLRRASAAPSRSPVRALRTKSRLRVARAYRAAHPACPEAKLRN